MTSRRANMEIFNAGTWRDKRTAASSRPYELMSAEGVLSEHVGIFNVMVAQLCLPTSDFGF